MCAVRAARQPAHLAFGPNGDYPGFRAESRVIATTVPRVPGTGAHRRLLAAGDRSGPQPGFPTIGFQRNDKRVQKGRVLGAGHADVGGAAPLATPTGRPQIQLFHVEQLPARPAAR